MNDLRIEEARKRIQGRPPPTIGSIITGEESAAEIRRQEIVNGWILEWCRDRALLTEAIKEIDSLRADLELLRRSSESELLVQLRKIHETRRAASMEEATLATLLGDLKKRNLP